ncbi:MAG: tetratricopeptide repeat protein [Alphaproteobacteria bacterium]|nr:tetratricopeptide repeat protein [Alphaproteobacteria bacterium]
MAEALATGLSHYQADRLDQAERIYLQVLAFDPDQPDALHLQGLVDCRRGRLAMASARIERAIAIDAANPAYHSALGLLRLDTGSDSLALASLLRVVALAPNDVRAHVNLAAVRRRAGELESALHQYELALALAPDDVATLLATGALCNTLRLYARAVPRLRRAVSLEPHSAAAAAGLGATLLALSQIDAGMAAVQRAIALDPSQAGFHNDLAISLQAHGDLVAAAVWYRRALDLDPGLSAAHTNLLSCLNYDAGQTCESLFAAYRDWERRHASALYAEVPRHDNVPDPERRLRIGYLSADFRANPIGFNIEGLIAQHDDAQFEVFCYAHAPYEDEITRQFRSLVPAWRPIHELSDREAAAAIRRDGIDILVSLGGHTGANRILICARKPAPIQASYGDLTTTGLATMDYWMTDPVLHPPGTRELFTEELLHLPLLVVHRPRAAAAPTLVPSLAAGHVTFGSFNSPAKITAPTVALWSRVLHAVPRAVLMLHFFDVYASPSVRARFIAMFARHGIGADRLLFEGGVLDHQGQAELYARVDVALDTFPFTGCTTTFEALWMGVPVVTLAGERWLGRMSAGILVPAGLPELVGDHADAFVEIAVGLARDERRRIDLRAGLRERVLRSPLCDHVAYARSVEAAYRRIWRLWCGTHADRR